MTAWYNEIDPFAAAWLRELIKAGVIAPGVVDERSIEDIQPDELMGYTQCHFFAGIGVWSYALRCAGWPDDRPVWTGSCPCQPFSAAGKRGGTADERHLWPAFYHLISQCRPVTVFGEQVASKDGLSWLDLVQYDLEAAGYTVGAADIPACGLGAPHIRNRLWFVADMHGGEQRRQPREKSRTGEEVWIRSGIDDDNGGQPHHMADSMPTGRVERRAESGSRQVAGIGESVRRVEDAKPHGRRGRGDGDATGESGEVQVAGRCATGIMGDAACGQQRGSRESGEERRTERTDRGHGESGELADMLCAGLQGHRGLIEKSISQGRPGEERYHTTNRPTNGFWADADWLPCRDGKHRPTGRGIHPLVMGNTTRTGQLRTPEHENYDENSGVRRGYDSCNTGENHDTKAGRPVEPGTFPLVNGTPANMVRVCNPGEEVDADNSPEARVMRLKGYGNCINSAVAIAFISAYIEVTGIKP